METSVKFLSKRQFAVWNFLAFQVGWFACALTASGPYFWAGPIIVAFLLALHLFLCVEPVREAKVLASIGAIGVLIDSTELAIGVFSFTNPRLPLWFAPIWFFAFYANFASTLGGCLFWLTHRPWLSAIFGFVGGPLTYYSGSRLGPIALNESLYFSLGVLGITWAIATPGFFRLSKILSPPPTSVCPATPDHR